MYFGFDWMFNGWKDGVKDCLNSFFFMILLVSWLSGIKFWVCFLIFDVKDKVNIKW